MCRRLRHPRHYCGWTQVRRHDNRLRPRNSSAVRHHGNNSNNCVAPCLRLDFQHDRRRHRRRHIGAVVAAAVLLVADTSIWHITAQQLSNVIVTASSSCFCQHHSSHISQARGQTDPKVGGIVWQSCNPPVIQLWGLEELWARCPYGKALARNVLGFRVCKLHLMVTFLAIMLYLLIPADGGRRYRPVSADSVYLTPVTLKWMVACLTKCIKRGFIPNGSPLTRQIPTAVSGLNPRHLKHFLHSFAITAISWTNYLKSQHSNGFQMNCCGQSH